MATTQDAQTDSENGQQWHHLGVEDALGQLDADTGGLTSEDAARRLERYGRNEITSSTGSPWYVTLGKQFVSPMIGILVLCFGVTLLLREWVDSAAIALILVLNAGLGFWQERKAEHDVKALESLSAPDANVLRDGQTRTVEAAELVPGDVVVLESGDRVPADLRLIEASSLRVDESMLTGESESVTKTTEPAAEDAGIGDRTSLAFSGTLVGAGRATGLVVATGGDTELGAINALVQGPPRKTPLEILTHSLEKRIGLIIGVVSAVLFGAGVLIGNTPAEMFLTIVALAVSVIPESLPIVLTVAMSVGVSRMARRNALVRSLPAVETLGSTTIIGSDKTGTLTLNQLTVTAVWTPEGTVMIDPEGGAEDLELTDTVRDLLRAGALTNEARPAGGGSDGDGGGEGDGGRSGDMELVGDAVDVAMASLALASGAVSAEERAQSPVVHSPYESELRMSQTVREIDGARVLFVKGSPDALAEASVSIATAEGVRDIDHEAIEEANDELAREGLRVLAAAFRVLDDDEDPGDELPPPENLTFLGLQGMVDPPRPGVADAIDACHSAGIRVIMITGDHPATARAIARQLHLDAEAEPLTGREIGSLDDDALLGRLREVEVAARVSPQDKMRIVDVLQEDGETVAVTGDGVNDAPALKAAALGVAMGASGTDVARESADVVLTDDNFVTVVDAVEQGRVTFNAIRKATHFLLATGAASLIAVTVSVFAPMPLIFLPVQMLFINVVTNGVQDIALAFERSEGDELQREPRSPDEGVLSGVLWIRTAVAGAWMALATVSTFLWSLDQGYSDEHARTLTLTLFVWMNFYLVHTSRFENRSLFSNPFGNRLLLITSVAALGLHLAVMSWPVSAGIMGFEALSAAEWGVTALLGLSVLAVVELDKLIRRRRSTTSA